MIKVGINQNRTFYNLSRTNTSIHRHFRHTVNKRQNTNYSFLPVTDKVSCIRRKRGEIICLQGNNKSMVIFVLKRRKVVR